MLDAAINFISTQSGHGPEVHPRGQNGYTTTYEWLGGLKLMENEKRPEMGLCLLADGDACEFYGFDKLALIYQALQLKATRLDLAVDGCRFAPSALRKLWLEDRVRTQARPMKNAKPGREAHRCYSWPTSPTGDTFYMGSNTSTQYARCYNSRGFTRFEMVLKQERAAQVMQALCNGARLAPTLGAVISQFVAFVNLDDANRSRCTVLPFWDRFIRALGSSGVRTRLEPRPNLTVERLFEYIEKQVATPLAVFSALTGNPDDSHAVLQALIQRGWERAKPKHLALIAAGRGSNPE